MVAYIKRVDAKKLLTDNLENILLNLTRQDRFRRTSSTKFRLERFANGGACLKCYLPYFICIINIYGDGKVVLNLHSSWSDIGITNHIAVESFDDKTYAEKELLDKVSAIHEMILDVLS